MDQHATIKAATQMTLEKDSENFASAVPLSIDTTTTHGAGYFDFLALPRELRDMIYYQFQRLHPDTPRLGRDGKPPFLMTRMVAAKPITPLLLLNKQVGTEYRDACAKRAGILISDYTHFLVLGGRNDRDLSSFDTENISFIHMHVEDWMNPAMGDDLVWTLSPLKDWLTHWSAKMPKLDSINISIRLRRYSVEKKKLRRALKEFVSLPKLMELKVITMGEGRMWSEKSEPNSKKLLVQWRSGAADSPRLIKPPKPYMETCCEFLSPLSFSSVNSSSDSDDSSSDSDDSNDDDGDDGDNGIDSENSDDDSESDGENNGPGNDFHGDISNGDDEHVDNAVGDANEGSAEMGSGGADTTSLPEGNQAPSYFDFFGLPPEIRDMIYDLPEMLDQEAPLYHCEDTLHLHYLSGGMAATKPRTSLLLLNRQFISEYGKRCEGRSGLFISETLQMLSPVEWPCNVPIPPKAAEKATFMHIHAGEWLNPLGGGFAGINLGCFKEWLSHWTDQMPKLESVSINMYTRGEILEHPVVRDDIISQLGSLSSVSQVTELRLIAMEEPEQGWLLWRSKNAAKTLLAHWKRERDVAPRVMDPRVSYKEDCCIGSLASDAVAEDSDDEDD